MAGELSLLEVQYSPSCWSKKHDRDSIIAHHVKFCQEASEASRRTRRCKLNVRYGPSERQKMDIFYPDNYEKRQNVRKVLVFIHGGYWQEMDKMLYSFVCATFSSRDVVTVAIGYDLCPDVTMPQIVEQVSNAVKFVRKTFPNAQLVLSGHSAGAHLSSMVASQGDDMNGAVVSVILISGVYDLKPLIHTYVNNPLKLTEFSAMALSPINLVKTVPFQNALVVFGDDESPAFKTQSEEYCSMLMDHGIQCELVNVAHEDHFSIMESLANDQSPLVSKILSFIETIVA